MRTSQNRAREEYQTPPQLLVDSMLLIVSQFPPSERPHALRVYADLTRELYARSNIPPAEWVQMLTDLAEREAAS